VLRRLPGSESAPRPPIGGGRQALHQGGRRRLRVQVAARECPVDGEVSVLVGFSFLKLHFFSHFYSLLIIFFTFFFTIFRFFSLSIFVLFNFG
jgi:hypothetical protein